MSEMLTIKGYCKNINNVVYPVSIITFFALIIRFHNASQLAIKLVVTRARRQPQNDILVRLEFWASLNREHPSACI